jgi:XTP/dITP diphosphohydrolase
VTRLLIATTNAGKQAEFRRLLASLDAEIVGPDALGIDLDVPEPFDTYAENAVAKAVAYAHASSLPTLADDSGIEVAALGWGPGVRSARWGGSDKAASVLEALHGMGDRRARMVCALALALPGAGEPTVEVFTGVVDGVVATAPRGAGGFGYDPIFELESGPTTAELADVEKDRISHRGRAVAAALPRLREIVTAP